MYPSERTLVESLVKAAVASTLRAMHIPRHRRLAQIVAISDGGYLGFGVDILDDSDDLRAVEWYSRRLGRIYVGKTLTHGSSYLKTPRIRQRDCL